MNTLRPFFLLMARASVFWLGAFGLFIVSIILVGLAEPDARLSRYVNPTFLAAFGFPLLAGWLAGAVIQEFQHTSFAALLPRVRYRVAAGFLTNGLAVTGIVAGVIALRSATPHGLLFFVIGLAAYCLGGIFSDPLSNWITGINVAGAIFVVASSGQAARVAADHPWITIAVCAAVGVASVYRLFARSTFRRKPWRATSPLPGRFALERGQETERLRRAKEGARGSGWRSGYLGTDPWRWVRAARHETRGAGSIAGSLRKISQLWALGLLIVIYAWADKGELSFGEAVARSIYDALLRSPYVPKFGEKGGPFLMVAIVIGALGVVTALFSPTALKTALAYPLSRRQLAQVAFRSGLVDITFLLFFIGPCLFAVGHLMGWLVGHELRFDFMPFFYRAILITAILLPLAHWGRLGLVAASRRKQGNSMIGVIFGITGFVVVVCVGTLLTPFLIPSPVAELVTMVVVLALSQLAYRTSLTSHYRTADLA